MRADWRALGDHPLAQRLGRELVPAVGGQLLAGQRGAEVGIVGADQSQHLLANSVEQEVLGRRPRRLGTGLTLRPSRRAASRFRNCLLTTC